MKIKKYIKIPIIVVIIIIVIIIISYINHKICLKKEEKLFRPLGEVVDIYGNGMSIYIEGTGDKTIVFMSGGGTSSPILDFKSLYSQLSDEYRIVVVEKFGYGFSDIVDTKRSIDVILHETREALSKVGINGPYILCPHSMSGIEALYWAQQYPEEVDAIIGLDMAVPEAYANYNINKPLLKLSSFAANIGLARCIPNISESDAIKYGDLSKEEKDIYKCVFYRRTATKTMLNEVDEIKNNALIVELGGKVDIPMLMLCSNGKGTSWNKDEWHNFQYDYIKDNNQAKLVEFNCGHYIHNQGYKDVAKEIKLYLNEL